jgi:hypothetical protein
MNKGTPTKVAIGFLAKIKKYIKFQAKTNERNPFMRAFALVLGLANTRYVKITATMTMIIYIGKVASLYAPIWFQNVSVAVIF